MIQYWTYLMQLTAVLILIWALDDLLLEILTLFYRSKPTKLSEADIYRLRQIPEKRLAIIIANWHESEILRRMIIGNLGRIEYSNYEIFLGVYPNDNETKHVAEELAAEFHQVRVVVNAELGPTSKGQMLNQIVKHLLQQEITTGYRFDAMIMQDSEDIIHPLGLKMMNERLDFNDFIQTPVLCLPDSKALSVRGTYIDEFSESHLKDLILRSEMKAAVPSAGVGTCLSRLLIAEMMNEQKGQLFNEGTLTEDYQLGLKARQMGFNSTFASFYYETAHGHEIIATRELFPNQLRASVRQKTRWTFGIAIQGWKHFGWADHEKRFLPRLTQDYFLWRDRRSLFNAPLTILSFMFLLTLVFIPTFHVELGPWAVLGRISMGILALRLLRRAQVIHFVYGTKHLWALPLRWVLSTYINAWAGLRALNMAFKEFSLGVVPKWDKTTHELPENFGMDPLPDLLLNEKDLEPKPPEAERELEVR